jgi:hypothetical protein
MRGTLAIFKQQPALRVVHCEPRTQTYIVADDNDHTGTTGAVTMSRPACGNRLHMRANPDGVRKQMLPDSFCHIGDHDANHELRVTHSPHSSFAVVRENDLLWWARVHDYDENAFDDEWLKRALFAVFAYEGLYNEVFSKWVHYAR